MPAGATLRARDNLAQVADMWPMLCEERIPGTPRPWLQTRMAGRACAPVDDDQGFLIHGVTAPVRLDVLDTMTGVLEWLEQAAEQAARILDRPLPRMTSGHGDDPYRHLATLTEWWDDLENTDPHAASDIAEHLDRIRDTASRQLGLELDGKILPFPCPYCLTVNALTITRHDELGVIIECTSGACAPPPSSSAHLMLNGNPVWRFSQWENLASACR